jgi:hypothetical protein
MFTGFIIGTVFCILPLSQAQSYRFESSPVDPVFALGSSQGNTPGCGDLSLGLWYQALVVTLQRSDDKGTVIIHKIETTRC